jgi:hypothetical protein
VVRLPEYSTTKPPEKSNFQLIATRLLSIPQAADLVQTTAMSAAIETAQEINKRNDNHVSQIKEAKKKWPSRNGLCIATRRMTRIVQRKKKGLWIDRAVAHPGFNWDPYRSHGPDPAGAIYLALPPLASDRTVFHSISPLSSAWMELAMLRAFLRFSRVEA